ncbi:hypothetical protein H4S07_003024 [Coemansia furcata]|uniref:Uncharacterized protein n=1 Tax=Coemansia furcata TaxID=417177 RepID=A0ACC1LJP8_9FUNG|nr:hypothetical protein H4S07_003024 [Coemansia furcata]
MQMINYEDEDINKFLAAASVSGPPSYTVAMRSKESSLWQGAVMSELESIDNNGILELVPRSSGMHVLTTHWVFCLN